VTPGFIQDKVLFRDKFPGRIRLVQIPIRLDESTALQKEPSQRSRGFVFMLLGAACAYLAGKMTLHIHLSAMLRQVEDLRVLFSTQAPWRSFAQKDPEFANAVDRIAPYRGMAPEVMQEQLIRLYQT